MFKCSNLPRRNPDEKRIGDFKMTVGLDQSCRNPSVAYTFEGNGKCQQSTSSSSSFRVSFFFFHTKTVCLDNKIQTVEYTGTSSCRGNYTKVLQSYEINQCKHGINATECENFVSLDFGLFS
jgi:hypothetical protein